MRSATSRALSSAAPSEAPRKRPVAKIVLASLSVLVTGGSVGAFLYMTRLNQNKVVSAEEFMAAQADDIRKVLASKETLFAHEIKLYGYSACPFFNKVRAFLQYNRIPFTEVEVEPLFKSEIRSVSYKKVPQLTVGSVRLVDSDMIIDALSPLFPSATPGPDVMVWRTWVSEELVRLVVVSINRSLSDAVAGYAYIDQFSATIPWYNRLFLKIVGAPVMYLVARQVTRPRLLKQGYTAAQLDSDDALYEQLGRWLAAVGTKPFHGGQTPDLADLAVFGVIEAMAGHPVYDRLMQKTQITAWMDRVRATFPAKSR